MTNFLQPKICLLHPIGYISSFSNLGAVETFKIPDPEL